MMTVNCKYSVRSIKKTIYALCAALGCLTAFLGSPPLRPLADNAEPPAAAEEDAGMAEGAYIARGIYPAVRAAEWRKQDTVAVTDFADIPADAWYRQYVDYLVSDGIIKGTSGTTFSPVGTFTVAECTAVITRYLGLEGTAASAAKRMQAAGLSGADLWYAGYVQVLCDADVLDPEAFHCGITPEGLICINYVEDFARPVTREEFASYITRSFSINTEKITSRRVSANVNTDGTVFITGGTYDDSISAYAADIADWELVAPSYREDILKAYYNGIFNGDDEGYFHPSSLLTRAEMAKVIAVINDASLRQRKEYRSLPSFSSIGDDACYSDADGSKRLNKWRAQEVLGGYADCVAFADGKISCSVSAPCPAGYFVESILYQKNAAGQYVSVAAAGIGEAEMRIPCTVSEKADAVLLLLRSSTDARVEGVLFLESAGDGSFIRDGMIKPIDVK